MKPKTIFSILLLTITSAFINSNYLYSEKSSPPAGSSGEPPDFETCVQEECHSGPAQASSLDNLLLLIGTGFTPTDTINLPSPTFQYVPNTAYNISFLLSSFTGRYGFQIVALDSMQNRAGIFTATDNINTEISSIGTRQYMGHKDANTYKNWKFRWTSPGLATGPVTFYFAYNTANANDSSTGDFIYTGKTTIVPDVQNSVEHISDNFSSLDLFPNPFSDQLHVSFSSKNKNNTVSMYVYTLDGRLVNQMTDASINSEAYHCIWNLSNLAPGIYFLKIVSGGSAKVEKILKT
ncbi:MAG: T9SS type A sorting domain-containing protein [Bacteroidetes bacterium]|nr:T9SS type A sorting domain-containing protein [Bacteroidota bacterium]